MLVSRRRSEKEIPVLSWWFRNNRLSPRSSRTFRTQSHWSFITGQCDNSEWILPTYLPYWMCFLIFILSSVLWSDDRACLAAGGGSRRWCQYCSDISGAIVYLRALQGHSGRGLNDPTLQDNVVIGGIIPTYLPHRMCVWSSFDHQEWIETWRSEFKQETNSILLAHWSQRQRTSRSCTHWLLCTTSSTILAQCLEETSRCGILGGYWSCDQGINILSNTIECNHPSRTTSSLLHSKSW